MQHTILPLDLVQPVAPVVIDGAARYQRFTRLTDRRQRRGVRSPLALIVTMAVRTQ